MPQPYFTDPNIGAGFAGLSQALQARKQSAYDQAHAEIAARQYNDEVAAAQALQDALTGTAGNPQALNTRMREQLPGLAAAMTLGRKDPSILGAFGGFASGLDGGTQGQIAPYHLLQTGRPLGPNDALTAPEQNRIRQENEGADLARALAVSRQQGQNQLNAIAATPHSASPDNNVYTVGQNGNARILIPAQPSGPDQLSPADQKRQLQVQGELRTQFRRHHGYDIDPKTGVASGENAALPREAEDEIIRRADIYQRSGAFQTLGDALNQARQDLMDQGGTQTWGQWWNKQPAWRLRPGAPGGPAVPEGKAEVNPVPAEIMAKLPKPAVPAAAPARPGAGASAAPAAAGTPPANALKEGKVTVFANGQRWTLRGGKPVQVQ